MAKDEIDRAARAGADDVAGASKQQEVAALLKKMKVEAEADAKAEASTENSETPASAEAQADAQTVAAADSIFASDAAYDVASAGMSAADAGGSEGGLSTGTLLAIGGVALVAGGIAIAANNDDDGGGSGKAKVDTVTGPASANEGTIVNFAVTGKPGATFSWSLSGTAANPNDVSSGLTGEVTLDDQGNAIVAVTLASDQAVEGAEALVLTVGDVASAPVTVNDVLPPAEDAILTTDTDNLDFSGTSGANHVAGTATGITGMFDDGTFTASDKIVGNGETVFDLLLQAGGLQPGATTLTNIAAIDIVNGGVTTTASFNASGWTGVGSINLVDGADDLQLNFTDLAHGVGRSIASGVSGSIYVEYTDDIQAEIRAGHVSSISQSAAGDVEANVATNEYASFSTYYSGPAPADIVVGNVDATVGNGGYFQVYASHTGGTGDITIGDISAVGGVASEVDVTVSATNYSQGGLHNIMLGNVDVAVGDSGEADVYVSNSGYNEVGDITIGDIGIAVGEIGDGDLYVFNYASAENDADDVTVGNITVGDVTISGGDNADLDDTMTISNYAYGQDGVVTAGNLVVGNVDVSVGSGPSASADFFIYQFAYASGTGTATAGDVTVGNITLSGGMSASVYMSVENTAQANTGASATVGNVTVGDIDMTIGQSGDIGFQIYHSAENAVVGTVGNLTVGDLSFDVATSASASKYYFISASATASGDASIGNVVIGNTTGGLGVNGYMSDSIYISADADAGVASIGDVTIGSIDVDLNDGADYSHYASIYAYDTNSSASVGNISIGDVGLFSTNGVSSSAEVYYYNYVYGDIASLSYGNISAVVGATANATVYLESYSESIGDVTLGDVDVAATGDGAYFYGSLSVSAWSGDMGNVTVGDVAVSAAADASSAYWNIYLNATNGDIGNVTVGNVSVDAGADAYASFYLSISTTGLGGGDVGNISLGNISVAAIGAGADAYAGVYNYATHDTGSFTVGDIALTANAGAATVLTASATLELYTSLGDITTGNVAIVFGGADADADIAVNNVYLTITASNDVTIGDISVSGGDGPVTGDPEVGENVDYVNNVSAADFAASVMLNVSAGGDITIGGVDYSGFGEAATINVSGFGGAGFIIGTAFDDTITDNTGTNILTGGDGADSFIFDAGNTGKTEATADQITDFLYADDEIDIPVAVNVGNYSEGTYADFAAFLAAADAGDKAVLSGQVGDNVWLAVDDNADNTVDFVIGLMDSNLANVAVDSFV